MPTVAGCAHRPTGRGTCACAPRRWARWSSSPAAPGRSSPSRRPRGSGGRRRVRRAAATALAVAVLVAAASSPAATAPRVSLMVAGRTNVLFAPRTVRAGATTVRVGAKRCAVPAATPLAALAAAQRLGGPPFATRDYGACGARAADASSLFVSRIGAERNRGRNGWVYKVGTRAGTTSAADPSGPFGSGRRLRAPQRVTWFWCVMARSGCQRTLTVVPSARRAAPGAPLRVNVLGYDDSGHAKRIAGAAVSLGGSHAVTGADGGVTIAAPA